MNPNAVAFLATVFIAVFACALVVMLQVVPRPVRQRLAGIGGASSDIGDPTLRAAAVGGWRVRVARVSESFSRLSLPAEGWEGSRFRVLFMNAGFRGAKAPLVFLAAKTVLTFAVPALLLSYFAVFGSHLGRSLMLLSVVVAATAGYFLPDAILARIIAVRKRDIFESFPDALDLMTICVEAGLGLDAALARVAREIGMKSSVLAQELHLVALELRAGSSRERALRDLAIRTGVEEIDLLVAMLCQADRFGTSVADSLRVHSDSLRTKRRQRAEEIAARASTKMLFPLLFCVFPSMMLVLMGPAFIRIYKVLLPMLAGE
jgi:tight adherence protein C